MGESFVRTGPDDTSTAPKGRRVRSRQQTIAANVVDEQYVQFGNAWYAVVRTMLATTYRVSGNASTVQTIGALVNRAGSGRVVGLRSAKVLMQQTAALASVTPSVKAGRVAVSDVSIVTTNSVYDADTMPLDSDDGKSTGLVGPTARWISLLTEASNSENALGGAFLTATLANPMWTQFVRRAHTMSNTTSGQQQRNGQESVIPLLCNNDPILLREDQAFAVNVVGAVSASNPTSNWWAVQMLWDEAVLL